MKTRLHVLLYGLLICSLFLFSIEAQAQINYSEDFEDDSEWANDDEDDFYITDYLPCNGEGVMSGSFYSYPEWGDAWSSVSISPSLGTSNGQEATLTFNYKILSWSDTAYPNTPDWGDIIIEYGSSLTGPWTSIGSITPENHVVSTDCAVKTITFTPLVGSEVYFRITAQVNQSNQIDARILIDDILVTQDFSGACEGTPSDITATASSESVCIGGEVTLSYTPGYDLSGMIYQWQSSANGTDYEDVTEGGDEATYIATQTDTTWYRVIVTCDAGGDATTSEPVEVASSGLPCYCEADFANGIEPITLVEFAGIDNASDAVLDGTPALEDFTSLDTAEVVAGATYEITLQGNTGGNWTNYFKVYIDFNHNGDLNDEGESFEIGSITQSTGLDGDEATGEITIPVDAMTGITTMRVFKLYDVYPDDPCSENEFGDPYGFGQAEDYLINISAAEGCTVAPEMAVVEADETTVCTTEGTELSLSVNYALDGITYQWQSSEDGEEFADIEGATEDDYETAPTGMDMWYRAVITCENGDLSTTTEPIAITTTGLPCYCESEFNNIEPISLVQFAGINNETSAELGGEPIEDFTSLTPGEVMQGGTYEITLMGNTGGEFTNYFAVYIDFNHNGNLNDEGEMFELGSLFNSDGTDELISEITIPEDAMLGLTYMRVLKLYDVYPVDPCEGEFGPYGYGQAEDYLLNVSEPPVFDYYNLQWPGTMTYPNVDENYTIYAQAYEPGVTEAAGLGEGVMGWIGFSTENTDPATWDESNWIEGTFNQTDNNNDEVTVTVDGSLAAGTYYYASRWQLADGPYTYGGFVGAWGDEGVVNGVLTVLCTTPEPTVELMTQQFCNGGTIADLQATATEEGGTIVWYATMDAETALPTDTMLVDGTTYFAAQMANDCESERVAVIAVHNYVTPPDVDSPQVVEVETGADATVEDLLYTGEGTVTWYTSLDDVANSENGLEAGAIITSGTYYATLTVDGCESDYMTVEVEVLLGTNGFIKGTFTYYPNPVKDMLNLSYSEGITGVEVFNLVGQRVMSMAIGQNDAAVDMAALASGTYVVKVSSGDTAAMIKVVKE